MNEILQYDEDHQDQPHAKQIVIFIGFGVYLIMLLLILYVAALRMW